MVVWRARREIAKEIGAFGVITVGVTVLAVSLFEAFRGQRTTSYATHTHNMEQAFERVYKYVESDSRLRIYTRDGHKAAVRTSDSEYELEYGIAYKGTTGKIISRVHLPTLAIHSCRAVIGERSFNVNKMFFR
jgi:hypothetical protein